MSFTVVLLAILLGALVIALLAWDVVGGGRDISRRMRRAGEEMRRQDEEDDAPGEPGRNSPER